MVHSYKRSLWVKNSWLKLIALFSLLALVFTSVFPSYSFAAGVPVYLYSVTQNNLYGTVTESSYDWSATWKYGRLYYFKVFAYSPYLSSEQYYSGNLSLQSVAGELLIQAFDGRQWVDIGTVSTYNSSRGNWDTWSSATITLPFNAKQIRYVTYNWQNAKWTTLYASIGTATCGVYLLGADQNTAEAAYNAANAAKASADQAAANAQNAYNAANTAATNAQNAYSAAQNAYNAANAAKASADQAAANTTYNGQSAAYWAYLAAQGGVDATPPMIQKVGGLNGATCTTTGTFYVVVQTTDNKAGQLQARAQVDGGTWTGWYNIPQNAIPVTLSSIGAHTITVEVKDAAGNISQATMMAFRV